MNWQIMVSVLFIIAGIGNLFKDFFNALITLVIGLALLCWGLKKKGLIKKNPPQAQIMERVLMEENFHATGVGYYEANIRKLAFNNPDWKLTTAQIISSGKAGKRIFKHNYINKPVKLQMEPGNPHDEHAVAVIIAGELVGYISREDNIHVEDILQNHEIKSISSFIGGGEYKTVMEDGGVIKDDNGFSVNVRIKYL